MSDISEDESGGPSKKTELASAGGCDGDLSASIDDDDVRGSKIMPKQTSSAPPKPVSTSNAAGDDLDVLFSELGAVFDKADSATPASANDGDGADDDFIIAGRLAVVELESERSSKPAQASKESSASGGDDDLLMYGVLEGKSETEVGFETKKAPLSSSENTPDLQDCTVPVLKEMLRERGLKVSGRKAELIDRLIGS
jgi:hypothetical protein